MGRDVVTTAIVIWAAMALYTLGYFTLVLRLREVERQLEMVTWVIENMVKIEGGSGEGDPG